MTEKYILALDQGTSSCRALLFNKTAKVIGIEQQEFTQIFPQAGWVEHDPEEIFEVQMRMAKKVLANNNISPQQIESIGIANQRETTVVWNKHIGIPVCNAIVWQDTRTIDICEELKEKGYDNYIKETTGLIVDSYFSATKLRWILANIKDAKEKALNGDLLFGTIDTWLIWKFTGGKYHLTDYSNASRTMLFNISTLQWDEKLLAALDIPKAMLPDVIDSSAFYGKTALNFFDGVEIPITGVAGDQQAALFGHTCFEAGMAKNTYGTGCFMLMNTGKKRVTSSHGLLTTIAWSLNGKINYALEGSIFIAGAAIKWLRDEMKIIRSSNESSDLAKKITDTGGVYFVPAFSGLGAPYWDMYAKGMITGITRGTGIEEITRAALESIAYQTRDVLEAMVKDSGIEIKCLKVDGGAANNDFLMQFQSDILSVPVEKPENIESTALGVAYLAGLCTGFWSMEEILKFNESNKSYQPSLHAEKREKLYEGWKQAVNRTKTKQEKI